MRRKNLLLITLLMALFAPLAMMGQETFALYEDATGSNSNIPVYGNWADAGDATAEFIIPASDIDAMVGGTISQMTFFLNSPASKEWNAPYEVYLSETDETTMTGLIGHDNATLVFTGTLNGNSTTMDVVFNTAYTYGGGNLLVGFYETAEATYASASFLGITTTENTAYFGYSGYSGFTSSAAKFLPRITFTYEPAPAGDCEAPATLVADEVLAHEATLTWTEGSGTYNVLYKTTAQSWDDATIAASSLSAYTYTLSGLAANTAYQARVISVCGDETSNPKTVSFTTPIACPAPTSLTVEITPGDGTVATFSWTNGDEETAWQLCLNGDEDNLIDMDSNPFTYSQFTPEQTYTAKVRAYCDDIDQSTWSNTVTFTPTDAYLITVNDGTGTNEYVPFYGYYADSGCQGEFIIPAEDLRDIQWGSITQLTFYVSSPESADFVNSYSGNIAKFEVYMSETENTTISSVDWSGTKVKNEAQLVITDYKMAVTFDQPYFYMGGNLMIGFKETSNGGYAHTYWYGVTAEGASVGGYGSSISQKNFLPKTTIAYIPGEEPSCIMPTGVTVNYTGGTTAEVSWTSDAEAWNIKVNGVETAIRENPYTIIDLELATTYEVTVQAVCDGSVSDWSTAVSFTTDDCLPENMCPVTIVLTDSYSDGWNGGQLLVLNNANNKVLGTYTIVDGGEETFELYVCDGTTIDFVYSTGSYPTENGWYITDINGEVIAEHTGCNSGCAVDNSVLATYTMNCTPATCIKPTNLTVNPGGVNAVISWDDEVASAWQICVNDDEDNLIEVRENPYTLEGLTLSTDYTVRVRAICGDDDYSNWTNNVSFTTLECEDFCEISYVLNANAYQGAYEYGWYNSGIKVYDADTDELIDFWTVPGGESTVTGTLAICDKKDIYFQWYCYYSSANDNVLVGGYTIYDNKGEVIAEENGPMSADVNYTMDCTLPSCMWPINITIEPSYTSATISWEGDASAYNLQYRTAPIFFFDGFEYGLEDKGWTSIANGEVPSSEEFANGWATSDGDSHSGNNAAASRSWANQVALSADNYLITPQLELKGTLKFWVKCSYPSDADEYEVLLSTDGNTVRDFTTTLQAMTAATGVWQEVVIDLSRYADNRGYIAIHHVYENGELLYVDDFGLYGTEEDAGRWEETTVREETSVEITGLEMDTWYEYLIQSVCDEEESEWKGGTFQTLNGNEKQFNSDGNWDVDANWLPEGVPTDNQNVTINAAVTIPENYVAVANGITLGTGGSILIKDGAELQYNSGEVVATIEKVINKYTGKKDNYYLIASPIGSVESTGVENLLSGDYDYYEFDATEELEWRNYEQTAFNMTNGLGYLYANSADVTLQFSGELLEPSYYYAGGNGSYYLTYDESYDFGTFNLLGNLYARKGYLYYYNSDNSWEDITDFYVMGSNGSLVPNTDPYLRPCEGAMVEATEASQRVLVATEPYATRNASSSLNMSVVSNNKTVDVARIRFGEGRGLKKIQMDRNSSKLYIPQDNKDFAVVYAEAQGEMPVSFKAETNGTYTISLSNQEVSFNYLHLIDNLTGNDVDMLANPSYSFEAKTTDYASRFRLVFATGNATDDNFVFFGNGSLVINNEGNATMNVYDVTGRLINTQSINGSCQVSLNAPAGVYMIQLVNGNNTKTQKIVVK